jgi:hypothetical protein
VFFQSVPWFFVFELFINVLDTRFKLPVLFCLMVFASGKENGSIAIIMKSFSISVDYPDEVIQSLICFIQIFKFL